MKTLFVSDDKDASISAEILKELEQIDSHTEKVGIPFVRIDDDAVAKEFEVLDELLILVHFENKIPSVYEGKNLLPNLKYLKKDWQFQKII